MNSLARNLINLFDLIFKFYYKKYKIFLITFFLKNILETLLIGSGIIFITNYFGKADLKFYGIEFKHNNFSYYFVFFILSSLFIIFLNKNIFKSKRLLNKDLITHLKLISDKKINQKKNLNLFSKILYRIQNYPLYFLEFLFFYLLLFYLNFNTALFFSLFLIIISIYNLKKSMRLTFTRMSKKISTFDYLNNNKSDKSIWSMELLFAREEHQIFLTSIKYFMIFSFLIMVVVFSSNLTISYLIMTYFVGLRMIISFLSISSIISLSIENSLIFEQLWS